MPGAVVTGPDGVRSYTRNEPDAVWTEVLPLWNAVGHGGDEQADVGFYLRLIVSTGRPVVELGVGYGRVARWTKPDYGVDQSVVALRSCAPLVPGVTLVISRLQDYVLSERAVLSYAPQNLLCLLGGPQDALDALSAVRRNTEPGGQLAFDVAVPHWDRIRSRLDRSVVHGQVGSLRLSYRTELLDVADAPDQTALRMHHVVEQLDSAGRVRSRIRYPPVPVHYFSPPRWRDMLTMTNWRVRRCWGGFAGEPLTRASRRQIWLVSR